MIKIVTKSIFCIFLLCEENIPCGLDEGLCICLFELDKWDSSNLETRSLMMDKNKM